MASHQETANYQGHEKGALALMYINHIKTNVHIPR